MSLIQQTHMFIDVKYINLISGHLDLFKQKRENLWNFRCPICGDSKKMKFKARGYLYENKGRMYYSCHNCNASMTLNTFMKLVNESTYKEYIFEVMQEIKGPVKKQVKNPAIFKTNPPKLLKSRTVFSSLKTISQLRPDHGAKKYIVDRKIPNFYHSRLYYCPKFFKWTNTQIPGKFEESQLQYEEPRLIIPLIDRDGTIIGYQGRSFDPKTKLRYITIILDDSKKKLFGLDLLKDNKDVYVLEGPIDSMFVDNSIAMCGSDISDLKFLGIPKERFIFVFDNENRNVQIVKKMRKTIDNGYRIVILPDNVRENDINDLRMRLTVDDIKRLLSDNTYNDLRAKIKLATWNKL